jgi:hypothetical protein
VGVLLASQFLPYTEPGTTETQKTIQPGIGSNFPAAASAATRQDKGKEHMCTCDTGTYCTLGQFRHFLQYKGQGTARNTEIQQQGLQAHDLDELPAALSVSQTWLTTLHKHTHTRLQVLVQTVSTAQMSLRMYCKA